jgi:hypothetical protein
MPNPTSITQINLTPIRGKRYFNIDWEWREKLIYFLMVDRFQYEIVRAVATGIGRAAGGKTSGAFYRGTTASITNNLAYIAGQGCVREADVEEVRADAIKHMGELAGLRFCTNIRAHTSCWRLRVDHRRPGCHPRRPDRALPLATPERRIRFCKAGISPSSMVSMASRRSTTPKRRSGHLHLDQGLRPPGRPME